MLAMTGSTNTPYRPAGTLSISTALQPYEGPWNKRLAAHLLRRAGFGGSPEEIERVAGTSMNAAVDALIHYPKDTGLPGQPSEMDPQYAQEVALAFQARSRAVDDATLQMQRMQIQQSRQKANLSTIGWWFDRMINSPAPLQEKMTLFWHGHFTSAMFQKGITPKEMVDQNWLFRSNALGNVREMTHAVSRDPAMLKYLDNARSNKDHPNENYARELMELFTLGIGNYTENDIRESARAFTGYTVYGPLRGGAFYFNPKIHDDGNKAFLNARGPLDGDQVVDCIFRQPAASRWFAQKFLNFFVYNEPEPQLIDAVAEQIRKNDFQIAPVMSMLLRSNVFYSDRAYRALVKSPVEFVVGTQKLFGLKEVTPQAIGALNRMGQVPFHPPSVKGWDGGATWLNSQTVLARENFLNFTVTYATQQMKSATMSASAWMPMTPSLSAKDTTLKLVDAILQGDAAPASTAKLQAYLEGNDNSALGQLSGENFEERMRGAAYLSMAMPAYQLN
jgi:uncharacterized protein (DUF1800 family)